MAMLLWIYTCNSFDATLCMTPNIIMRIMGHALRIIGTFVGNYMGEI